MIGWTMRAYVATETAVAMAAEFWWVVATSVRARCSR